MGRSWEPLPRKPTPGRLLDGKNIWVCNVYSSTVQKFLASTGALIGTYGTGSAPIEVLL